MPSTRRSLFLMLTAAALAGCAATVDRSGGSSAPLARPSGPASRRIAMSLTRADRAQAAEDWQAFREEWQTAMTAAAADAGASFVLLPDGTSAFGGPGILLKTRVNDFRYVSQAKRYGLGVFTGNAMMDIDVDFIETPNGRLLGQRRYGTSSSGGQGIFSAMTPKQVEATAREIIAELRGRQGGTA